MPTEPQSHSNEVVNAFLSAWAAALSAREFKVLSELFDESVLFVATGPTPLQGPTQIQAYYEQAPQGLSVQSSLIIATCPMADLVHAVVEVEFDAPGGISLQGRLGLSLIQRPQGWKVSSYQLSANRAASG